MTEESSNRRVVKNTVVLYCRMFITMAIGMWTSRLVLNALGFTDQGVYNVVGGFVGLTSLITASISGSISRFITFEIGRGDMQNVNRAVQNAITVQWVLAGIVVVVAETIGLWFLNNKLVIPPDRLFAAHVLYQLSIGNIVISLISSAPNALVFAHERFNVFAVVSIVNALAALAIGLSITYFGGDRLILYGLLQFIVAMGVRIFYGIYCHRSFPHIKFRFAFDKKIFFPIFKFAGWNSIGTSAAILRNSGTSILLNIFGGPIANTINGIANSLNNLVTLFVNDFTTAYSIQITKRYAAGDEGLIPFIHRCSKFSCGLMLVMAVPIFFNVEPLLILWLKKIPEGTGIFARLVMVYLIIEGMSRPMITAKNATGEIRNYQLVVGGILLFTIPLSYVFLKCGLPIYFSYVAIVITSVFAFFARIWMLRGDIRGWSSRDYVCRTLSRCALSMAVAVGLPLVMHIFMPEGIASTLAQCLIGFAWCLVAVYFVACDKHERIVLQNMVKEALGRLIKK